MPQTEVLDASCARAARPVLSLDATALYRHGHLIRLTEQLLLKLFSEGLLSGTTHTCLGQEVCAMSVVRALQRPHDHVLSNHRNHGHFLTYSGDVLGLVAEVMGREAGVCGGIGGSQHLAFRGFHSNGVQAGMTAIGVGQALASRLSGDDGATAIIVGDGTLGEGLLYESMNLASIWRLPAVFVVEQNHIAQTTPTAQTIGGDIAARGEAFGLRTIMMSDADPDFVARVDEFICGVRKRQPSMLVIDTERLGPHSKSDDKRDPDEIERIRRRDPLAAIGRTLPAEQRASIEAENQQLIAAVHEQALLSPPAPADSARRSILRPPREHPAAAHDAPHGNVRLQLNSALDELLRDEPRVLLLGEDLHDPYGGAFKVTEGLSTRYPDRVLSTPISEAAVVGTGIGLALSGYRPIVEIMFADFTTLAMDQLFNHAVKFPGMFRDTEVPLIIRTPSGGWRGYGPTHSQCLEGLFSGVPGLTVLSPTHRHPIGTLLKAAVLRWPNPTMFFEHKLLYGERADPGAFVPLDPHPDDPGLELFPTIVRRAEQPDVTVVTYGGMLPMVERWCEELAGEEIEIEIIAPALLNPLPRHQLVAYLLDRRAVLFVEEGYADSGPGPQLGAALLEAGFTGRFRRVGTPPVPIPAARSLEVEILPGRVQLIEAIAGVLEI
jgi:2-oxoisovalerate dehydrogenase E1 component